MKTVLIIAMATVLTAYFAIGFIGEMRSPKPTTRGDSKFSTAVGVGFIWGLILIVSYQEVRNSHPKKFREAWREAWREVF